MSSPNHDDIEYEVLYYKRKNKVHKSKGVSKTDGRLLIRANQIVLREVTDSCAESHDSGATIYTHTNKELAEKCRSLQNDEVIVLGGHEVQIIGFYNTQVPMVSAPVSMPNRALATHKNGSVLGAKRAKVPLLQSKKLSTEGTNVRVFPIKRKLVSTSETNVGTEALNHGRENLAVLSQKQNSFNGVIASVQNTNSLPRTKFQRICPLRSRTSTTIVPSTITKARKTTTSLLDSCSTLGSSSVRSKSLASVPTSLSKNTLTHVKISKTDSKDSSTIESKDILPHIPLPVLLAKHLRPHQVIGIDFLWNSLRISEGTSAGAILADEMGLGKTLMTVAIIAAQHRQERSKQFLVVCPSSLVINWENEFNKWLGRAGQPKRVVLREGGEEGRAQIRAYCNSMKHHFSNHLGQVLICSYELFRMNIEQFTGLHTSFRLLVVDEGHRLKNSAGSQTLSALESVACDARLVLTATPVQNNLAEFYSLANFCRPGVLGELSDFRRNFERPISAANQKDASSQVHEFGLAQSLALDNLTKTFMLRRLQKDVLKFMLPQRTEALLFCRPSKSQCDLYFQLTQNVHLNMSDALNTLTTLRKICSHPSLLSETSVLDNMSLSESALALSGKLLVLDALLQSIRNITPDDKVVVISNFTSALDVIEKAILEKYEYPYLRLDGTTVMSVRQSLVDTFNFAQSKSKFCFLLSSKAGGCGLNLVGANRLVMFDPDWNPASDIQAMGRIYRTGQTKPTFIYRLFTAGTVEEVIYQRQMQKGNLTTLTIDGHTTTTTAASTGRHTKSSTPSSSFTKEELKDCFELKKDCLCDTQRKVGASWTYNGPDSLDCNNDAPLLHVAKTMADTLGYIHIVNDDEMSINDSAPCPAFEEESLYNTDDEEENEL